MSDSVLTGTGAVRATVRVTNTGPRAGKEAVLWYLTDEVGRITRPVRLLKHFEKQDFQPGQTRELAFSIEPQQSLSYPGPNGERRLEDGFFTLRVGDQKVRFRYASATAQTSAPVRKAMGGN